MPKVYGYTRVSHIDSFDRGLSLGTQEDTIRAYFEQRIKPNEPDMEWGGVFCDPVVSAYRKQLVKRPQGANLNHVLKKGDVVVFARLDRAFRSMLDFCLTSKSWDEKGVRFVFCDQGWDTSTATGRLLISNLAAFAEFQSAMISERTKEGLQRKKLIGGRQGFIPRGRKRMYSALLRTKIVVPDKADRDAALQALRISREHPEWGHQRISDALERWLAEREGRKPQVATVRKHRKHNIRGLLDVAKEWEEILAKEKNPGSHDGERE